MNDIGPIAVVQPDNHLEHAFFDEVMKAEGLFHFHRGTVGSFERETLAAACAIVALPGDYSAERAELLALTLARGGRAVVIFPTGALAEQLGVRPAASESTQKVQPGKANRWQPARTAVVSVGDAVEDARVVIRSDAALSAPPEPLLCPGTVSQSIDCEGQCLADLIDQFGKRRGPAIVRRRVGRGAAYIMAYDLVKAVLGLRHGNWDLDQRDELLPLRGPRHINGLFRVAGQHSRQVPVADVHQDVLRGLLADCVRRPLLPRLWHFPAARPVEVFIKSDGCGEEGAPIGIELAERYGHAHNFFRAPESRYDGGLLREWHRRGHHISLEADICSVTYNRRLSELGDFEHRQIRRIIEQQADRFERETKLPLETLVIHGCQWTGAGTARILMDHDWRMPFHFCGHDPRMSRGNYGPYSVASALPMRYFDPQEGLLDLFLQPCTIDDSQSITEPSIGTLAMDQVEYVEACLQFIAAARDRWHVPHVGTYHPCYLIRPPGDPRRTFEAANMFYAAMAAWRIKLGNLREWEQFVRARDTVSIKQLQGDDRGCVGVFRSQRPLKRLTLIVDAFPQDVRASADGREQERLRLRAEGRDRAALVVDFDAGQERTIGFAWR